MPRDLVSTATLSQELGTTRRNVNDRLRCWGVKRYPGAQVSRAEVVEKKARLGSPTQAANSAKARQKPEPPKETADAKLEKSRAEAERGRSWVRLANEKLDLELRQGSVLKTDEVRRVFQAIGRMHSALRVRLPAQLAPMLVGKTDINEIEAVLERELRAVDEGLANEIEMKFGGVVHAEAKPDTSRG